MSDDGGLITIDPTPSPAEEARAFLTPEQRRSADLANRLTEVEIENRTQDRDLRKTYANRILIYLEAYSSVVGILLLLHGWKIWGFALEPEIVATLVGSTAVAAIGLVGFIAKGLFK